MSGLLTTHVLDTSQGRPAAGMQIELFRLENGIRRALKRTRTNARGRTDEPLLSGERSERLECGVYELVFDVGGYFAQRREVPGPPFLGHVPVRFGVADPSEHYHVPLIASPWSYSTYRGS